MMVCDAGDFGDERRKPIIVEPTAGPVELVSSVTGDPEPLKQPSGLALDVQGKQSGAHAAALRRRLP